MVVIVIYFEKLAWVGVFGTICCGQITLAAVSKNEQ